MWLVRLDHLQDLGRRGVKQMSLPCILTVCASTHIIFHWAEETQQSMLCCVV